VLRQTTSSKTYFPRMDPTDIFYVIFGFILFMNALFSITIFQPWLRCRLEGLPVDVSRLIAIRLRNIPLNKFIDAYITIRKWGIEISLAELETEYQKRPKSFDLYVSTLIEEHRKAGETLPEQRE